MRAPARSHAARSRLPAAAAASGNGGSRSAADRAAAADADSRTSGKYNADTASTGNSPGVDEPADIKHIKLSQKQLRELRRRAVSNGAGAGGTSGKPSQRGQEPHAPPARQHEGQEVQEQEGKHPLEQQQQQNQCPARPPRLQPLPYWCVSVTVVGLPQDQLVFCFQTPTQASAAARQQARVEAAYGGRAVKLCTLPGDKVHAILDRWQYAVAQLELSQLDARPPLWWRYESAIKGLSNDAALVAAVSAASADGPPNESDSHSQAKPANTAAGASKAAWQQQQTVALTRRQRRRPARKAAKGQQNTGVAGGGSASPGPSGSNEVSRAGNTGARGSGLLLAPSAFRCSWEVCTLRGLPDGSVVFKFGSGFEPLPGPNSTTTSSSSDADTAPSASKKQQLNGDAGASASGSSSSSGDSGSASKNWLHKRQRRHLLLQQQQRCQEGVAWSHTLRLATKFPDQAERSQRKLQEFVSEWEVRQSSSTALGSSFFPSYEKAAAKLQRRMQRLAEERQEQGQEEEEEGEEEEGESQGQGHEEVSSETMVPGALDGQQAQQAAQQPQQPSSGGASQAKTRENGVVKSAEAGEAAGDMSVVVALVAALARSGQAQAAGEEARRQGGQSRQPASAAAEAPAPTAEAAVRSEDSPAAGGTGTAASAGSLVSWLQPALAAAATFVFGALQRIARRLLPPLACSLLALYRRFVPVPIRRLFWRSWPPKVCEAHVSPSLASLLGTRSTMDDRELAAAGFDSQGQTAAPLADLPAWRIEALTLCGVRDMELYRTALTHKSALPLELRLERSYERLEFLGDSVLGLTCRTLLMHRCTDSDEGQMTKLNSLLVSGASNARYASFLGLERYVLLEPKTFREGAQHKPALLADTFEALLGALYLDRGFAVAQRFCMRVLHECVDWAQLEAAQDYKALLCRYAATQQKPQPRFSVRNTSQREFKAGLQLPFWTVDVAFKGQVLGSGGSFDKRSAEQAAARQALERLGELPGR